MNLSKQQLLRVDFYSWLLECGHLPNGQRYGFQGYDYLKKIAEMPWSPGDERYIKKSAQCGVSELAIQWMFWLCERRLADFKGIGYIFPAREQLHDHIKARVDPILEIKRFHENLREANLRFIRYCNVPLYFRSGGGGSKGAATKALKGWPADSVIVDEFDEYTNPITIIPAVQARLNASKYKWIFGMSTPTHPDTGIDRVSKICTQYNWYIKCDKCKKEFSPLNEVVISGFENCVIRDDDAEAKFLCPNCREFTQTCGAPGEWRKDADYPGQRTSFSISRLFLPNTSLTDLLDKYEEALNLQEFYNSDLGLPYSPPNSRLSRANITDCCNGDVDIKSHSSEATWAGIDVGKQCHYLIGKPNENGDKQIISYGKCNFSELDNILSLFSVKYMVIDLRPYEQEVKKILRGERGRYACDFNAGNMEDWYKITKVDSETIDKTVRIVKADRTQTCDHLIDQIVSKKKFVFPARVRGDNDFISQMCSPMRIEKMNKDTGEVRAVYRSESKKDHYFFAAAYLNLAFNLKKSSFAKIGGLFF